MLLTTDPACNHPRRGWATLTSFVLQTAAVVIILALPMLQPGLLPPLHAAPPLVPLFIPKFVPVVGQPGGSSIPTRPATLTAPWRIPPTIDRSADKQNANIVAVDEPPCISCLVGVGPGPGIPIGVNVVGTPVVPPPPVAHKPLRVSIMMDGFLIHRVQPDYPSPARQVRVQGAVVLAALISKEGTIENLRVLSGHPMLIPAAMSAVKQWKYRPYILNGDPIEVDTQITVNFLLSGN